MNLFYVWTPIYSAFQFLSDWGFYHFLFCSLCTMSLVQTLKVFFISFTFSVKTAASLSLLHNWMMNKITSTVFSVAWSTLQNSQLHQLTSTCDLQSTMRWSNKDKVNRRKKTAVNITIQISITTKDLKKMKQFFSILLHP